MDNSSCGSDLANLGTVLRAMAYTNPRKGFNLLPHALQLSNGMWNQYGLYYFYKGAWCCCRAADGLGLSLMPPQDHPLQQNKQLDAATLAEWFHSQAAADEQSDQFPFVQSLNRHLCQNLQAVQ